MSKPSGEELVSLIDKASRLLDKNRSRPASLEEITAMHQELNVAVDYLAEKDPGHRQLHMLKCYKAALQTRKQYLLKEQKATAN